MENKISVNSVIQFGVKKSLSHKGIDWNALSDFLREKTKEGGKYSYRSIAKRAGLSHSTIGNIINKRHKKDIGVDTLRALADAIEVNEQVFLSIAYGNSISGAELEYDLTKSILEDFEHLKEPDREFFRPYLLMMRGELDRRMKLIPVYEANANEKGIRKKA